MGFSYPNNAQVRGDFLYIRDANGNIISGHYVSDGDYITVLDVGYTKQLAYVEYPTSNGVLSGYVTNVTSLFYYFHEHEWKNGSTTEIVYDTDGVTQIGSISPYETATVLFQRSSDGMYAVVYDTDKGANTKSGFVHYSGHTTADDPAASAFSYPNNAQVKGDFLYVRDSNGNILSGHYVSDGDYITVLDVSYSKQLVKVEYPTPDGILGGYVTNATNIINYFNPDEWNNGSTTEIVYDLDGVTQIGSIGPYENATPIYRTNGMTCVVYNTDKGTNTKSGLVRFSGTGVYNDPSKSDPAPVPNGGTAGAASVSDALVSFIATYESYSATPYRGLDYQNSTIGYGHVIMPGENLTYLTKDQALALLKSDLVGYAQSVNNEFGSILTQQQFDALTSFCYNCGKNVWSQANLTNAVKTGASLDTIKTDFTNWCHCNGSFSQGLYNRRLDEFEMYAYGDYERTH